MLIREFVYPQDYEQAAQLWRSMESGVRFGASDTPAEIEKKTKCNPELFLVAEEDGKVIGTLIGGFDGRRGTVYHLAVARAQRGRGVATQLLNELEARLKPKGCTRAFLVVYADNAPARALYEKLNWGLMPDDVVYAKDLS